jgi:hypothetical protein
VAAWVADVKAANKMLRDAVGFMMYIGLVISLESGEAPAKKNAENSLSTKSNVSACPKFHHGRKRKKHVLFRIQK